MVLLLSLVGGVSYFSFLPLLPSLILGLARVSYSLQSLFKGTGAYSLLLYPLGIVIVGLGYYTYGGLAPVSFGYFLLLFTLPLLANIWATLSSDIRGALFCVLQLCLALTLSVGSSFVADFLFDHKILSSLLFSFVMFVSSRFMFICYAIVALYPLVRFTRLNSFPVLLSCFTPFFVLSIVILYSLFCGSHPLLAQGPAHLEGAEAGVSGDEEQPVREDEGEQLLPYTFGEVFTPQACIDLAVSQDSLIPTSLVDSITPDKVGDTSPLIQEGLSFAGHRFHPIDLHGLDVSPYQILTDEQVAQLVVEVVVNQVVEIADSGQLDNCVAYFKSLESAGGNSSNQEG